MQSYLLKHRKTLWDSIQSRVIEIFKSTSNFFLNLSIRELFDILSVTNTLLEIGIEFSQPQD